MYGIDAWIHVYMYYMHIIGVYQYTYNRIYFTHIYAIASSRYLPNNSAIVLSHPQPADAVRVRWWDPSSNNTATTPGTCVAVAGGVRCPKPQAWEDALAMLE